MKKKTPEPQETQSALDAQLAADRASVHPEEWKASVAIAKEARAFGASMQRAPNGTTAYKTFPR